MAAPTTHEQLAHQDSYSTGETGHLGAVSKTPGNDIRRQGSRAAGLSYAHCSLGASRKEFDSLRGFSKQGAPEARLPKRQL